jgi:hypothetical protein
MAPNPTCCRYAKFPGITNCYTKMLLGEYCGLDINITKAMFDEALRRVHRLAFVGLTDAFNASVCLFHHQFGGVPDESQFTTHTRNGKHLQKRKTLQCGCVTRYCLTYPLPPYWPHLLSANVCRVGDYSAVSTRPALRRSWVRQQLISVSNGIGAALE